MQQLGYKPKEFKVWSEAFFYCRKARGLTISEISRRVGESRRTVQEWEDGISYPAKGNTSVRLYGNMHNLKAYKNLLPKELQDDPEPTNIGQQIASEVNRVPVVGRAVSTAMSAAMEKADIIAAEAESLAAEAAEPEAPRPHKWNEALKKAMRDAGFSQRELAQLVGVHASSISMWSLGDSTPIAEHWEKLVDLFPELRDWDPSPRVQEKPGREPGLWTNTATRPVLKTVEPPPATPLPIPSLVSAEPTIADVATAYAIARVKESAMRTEIAKFEERLLEAQIALEDARKQADAATAEAEAAHKRLLEMATR